VEDGQKVCRFFLTCLYLVNGFSLSYLLPRIRLSPGIHTDPRGHRGELGGRECVEGPKRESLGESDMLKGKGNAGERSHVSGLQAHMYAHASAKRRRAGEEEAERA